MAVTDQNLASSAGTPDTPELNIDDSAYDNLTMEELQQKFEEETGQDVPLIADEQEYEVVHQDLTGMNCTAAAGGFRYAFPDGNSLVVSVPDGARSNMPVRVDNTGFLLVDMYRDGVKQLYESNAEFSTPGLYVLHCQSLSVDQMKHTVTDYQSDISFTITEDYVNHSGSISAPSGMIVKDISLNGRKLLTEKNQTSVTLAEDGIYQIQYTGRTNPALIYQENFTLDTKPPVLHFSEDISKTPIYPPLRITCEEKDVKVTIIHDGVHSELTEEGITSGGSYHLTAEDRAGNVTEYQLQLSYGHRGMGSWWIILAIAFVIAAIIQIIYLRRHRQIK